MKLSRRKFVHVSAGAAALSTGTRFGSAQGAYPSRPIHVIVGFTPGAAADVAARVLSQAAGPILGQQIVVENRPGAGSSIAAEYVAHAASDGYTVFLATLSIIANQIINPNASLDLTRDFAPIALLESGAIVLVVNPASDIRSVAELIALAKAKPGQMLHATAVGSLPHFASELFAQRAGVKLVQVPSAGGPRCHRRPCHDNVLAGLLRGRSDRGGQAQSAGDDGKKAGQRAARRAHHGGGRDTRL